VNPPRARNLFCPYSLSRDANSLRIYAQNQRMEVDGTTAGVLEDTRAQIARGL
jgi:hypothetical protein